LAQLDLTLPPPTIGDPKTDYKIRAVVARVGLSMANYRIGRKATWGNVE
jgi:hypothetical protein